MHRNRNNNAKLLTGDIAAAFDKHYKTYGGLDICINNAEIGNPSSFIEDSTDGIHSWDTSLM